MIKVPPLASRLDDIPELAQHFMESALQEMGRPNIQFLPEAIDELQKLPWSGNIRELRNVIERLIILCDKEITADDVKRYASPLN